MSIMLDIENSKDFKEEALRVLNAACCCPDKVRKLLRESPILVVHLPFKEQWFHATAFYTTGPSRLN